MKGGSSLDMNLSETQNPLEEVEEIREELESSPNLNVSDVMSVLAGDISQNNLSDTDIKTFISILLDHSKEVEAMKEKAVQVLANRLH